MKIFILGPSGVGTTTLGCKIAGDLGITHQDSDDLFWEPTDSPFASPRESKEFAEVKNNDLQTLLLWTVELHGEVCCRKQNLEFANCKQG